MTLRLKLTATFVAVTLVANSLLSLVVVEYLESGWLDEVQSRVGLDLKSARAAYDGSIERTAWFLRAAVLNPALSVATEGRDAAALRPIVSEVGKASGLDVLVVIDAAGKVVCRGKSSQPDDDDVSQNPLVAQALRTKSPAWGTIIVSAEQLRREGPALAERARLAMQPTPAARPIDAKVRTDGLVAAAAVPINDRAGKCVGLLYGGNLLNQRLELIDAIQSQVFGTQADDGKVGTVTLFLGDARIATNVPSADGRPALGTRLSREVFDEVLGRGGTWLAPAFVIHDWYIAAYEPIRDPQQKIIGALYVGQLRAPFLQKRNTITGVVLVMVLAATLACLLLTSAVTNFVLRPVGRITAMAQRIIGGDLSARVGIHPPGEMGVLCRAVDRMADAVGQRETRLKQLTRQQIGHTEKLASLGRLAAGVAHEINNPLTGVLTFACLMREKSNMDDQDKEDLDLMIHETTRAAEIVRGLLDFARERAAIKEPLDVNEVVRRTVRLIRNQKLFERIVIEEEFGENLPEVDGDMNQLQQVFLNLSLNACEAMPQGGLLTIRTGLDDGKVSMRMIDSGCGIKKVHFERIFEPFFTTKPVGKGTGLGLSVSYGIVQQHGGVLEIESEEGQGTTVTVLLPPADHKRAAGRPEITTEFSEGLKVGAGLSMAGKEGTAQHEGAVDPEKENAK